MKIAIRDGDHPETGILVVPAGMQIAEPMVFDATFSYKKLMITLEPNAVFHMHEESMLEELTIVAHAHAQCTVHVVITQSQAKKITLSLAGEAAHVSCVVTYALSGEDRVTLYARQEHHAPCTKSSILSRGVLADNACVEHKGMIFVARDAVLSQSRQNNKTILLSAGSRLDSSPELEVLQQNVQCSHGTAVGPLDEEQLLYLCSRGLTVEAARRLLLEAFFDLSDKSVKKRGTEGIFKKLQEMV